MRSPRLLLSLAGLGSALAVLLAVPLAAQHPLPPPPTSTQVTAGGATATTVTQSGATTNVSTGTVSGGNAYNQFSSFQVANGTTVNLNIPGAATNNNLLNLINGPSKTPTQIFGIVNSLLSGGAIGGNVYFADPNGIVIGSTGVVNVGSLTLATPSSDFVANFFNDVTGNTGALVAGTEPITSDGLIAVLGQIHSVGPTSIQAPAVDVSGSITTGAAQFSAAVNTSGLLAGQGITIQGSAIAIDGGLYGASTPAMLNAGGGDIHVNANASDSEALASAIASITVGNATLSANNITIGAKASATSNDSIIGTQLDPFSDNSSFPWDITGNAAENTSTAQATVQVGGGGTTTLTAAGNVSLTAEGDTSTTIATVAPVGSFSFGSTDATATANLASSAKVTAGGSFNLAATITNTLKVNPSAIGPGTPAAAAALGEATSNSSAALDGVVHASTIGVTANNTDSFSTAAGASAADNGLAGISAAIGLYSAQANASLSGSAFATGADTTANSVTTPALNVSALSNNQTDQVQSSSSVSDDSTLSTVTDSASGGIPFLGRLADFLANLPKSKQPNSDSDPSPLALSAAVSYLSSSNAATTTVTGTASSTGGSAGISSEADDLPQIDAAGTAGGAKASIGGGVAFGTYANTATTTVSGAVTGDQGVSITATASMPNPFNLSAFTSIPGEFSNLNFVAPSSFTDGSAYQQDWNATETLGGDLVSLFDPSNSNGIAQFLNDNLGLGNVVTSFVNTGASAEGGKGGGSGFGLAGSINILSLTNQATATVADGADIQAPHGAVNVNASANAYLINVVGMAASLGQLEGKNPGAKGDGALGGSYNGVSLANGATASINDGALVQSGGAVNVNGDTNETLINITQAGDNAGKLGINGTFAWITLDNTALGYIESNATVNAAGDVNVNAANNLTDFTISGALGYGGAAEVGATVGWNAFTNDVEAYIGDPGDARNAATGEVTAGGNVNVQALANETLWNISLAAEAATGQTQNGTGSADKNEGGGQQQEGGGGQQAKFGIGISGNVSINDITDTTLAFINNAAQVLATGNIGISAQDTSWAVSAGVAAALATKGKTTAALAGAFARNDFSKTTSAFADNAVLAGPVVNSLFTNASDVSVDANSSGDLLTISAGGSVALGSNGLSLAGSVNNNVLTNTTSSGLGGNLLVDASGDAKATAEQADKILSIAGSLSFGGKAGIGAALDFSTYNNTNDAFIGSGAQINASGDVIVNASTDEQLLPIAASLAGGQGFGISGSASKDEITNSTNATVEASAAVDAVGQLQLKADDASKLLLIVGSLGGGSNAGVGLAGAISIQSQPLLDREVNAVVDNGANLQAGSVNIAATQEGSADTIVAGIGGAETAGIAASLALNYFTENTLAQIQNGASVTTSGGLALQASDSIQTLDVAGEIAGAGTAALGASADVEFYNRNVNALLGGSINAGGNVTVDANLSASLWSVAAAASLAGTGDLAGAASAILGTTNTTAAISSGASVSTPDSIALTSERSLSLKTIDGQLGISAEVGVGGAVSLVDLTNSTVSNVGSGASVTALGNGAGLPELTDANDGSAAQAVIHGLALTANSDDSLLTIAAGGQVTTGIAVSGSVVLNQISSTTEAYVDTNATINPLATQNQAAGAQGVDILAQDGTTLTSAAGALAAGLDLYGVGVGAAINLEGPISSLPSDFSGFQGVLSTNLNGASANASGVPGGFTKTVLAGINNGATVNALDGLSIAALSNEDLTAYNGSVGAGLLGIAGTVEMDDFTPNTLAYFGSCATLANCSGGASGNVGSAELDAEDSFTDNTLVGDANIGGAALGASVLISTVASSTQAYIGARSSLTVASNLLVNASFTDSFNAAALAGGVGVVAANVPYASITDQSANSAFIADDATVSAGGDVELDATSLRTVTPLSGAAIVGALGAGATILDVNFDGSNNASIGNGGSVTGDADIFLFATLQDTVPEFLPDDFVKIPVFSGNTIPTGILGATAALAGGTGGSFDLTDAAGNNASIGTTATTTTIPAGIIQVDASTTNNLYAAGAAAEGGLAVGGADLINLTSQGATTASLGGTADSTHGSVNVSSNETETLNADATGIGIGFLAGQGEVAKINDTSTNAASESGNTTAGTQFTLSAKTKRTANATSGSTTAGLAAGGVSFADIQLAGSTKALIDGIVGAGTSASVLAQANDTATINATASSDGVLSGAGAVAGTPDGFSADPSRINPAVQAWIESSGSINAPLVQVSASDTSNLSSTVDDQTVFSGAHMGFEDAQGLADPSVKLTLDGALSGGTITLGTTADETANAGATASATLALLDGYFTAAGASAGENMHLDVNGSIQASGSVLIGSNADNFAGSSSDANAGVFNILAGGFTHSNATINAGNAITIGGSITSTAGGVNVGSSSFNDITQNSTTAGTGSGIVTGAASQADTLVNDFTSTSLAGTINAVNGTVTLNSQGEDFLTSSAGSQSGSFAAVSYYESSANSSLFSGVNTDVSGNITAAAINLNATMPDVAGTSSATSSAGSGFAGSATANADTELNANPAVNFTGSGTLDASVINIVASIGDQSAFNDFSTFIGANPTAGTSAASGSATANATSNENFNPTVNLNGGTTIITGSLTVKSLNPNFLNYSNNPDVSGVSAVTWVAETVEETVDEVVGWIPFIGDLVKSVTKWVTKEVEEITNSTTAANSFGRPSPDNTININSTIEQVAGGNGASLVIGANGQAEAGSNGIAIQSEDGSDIVLGNVINSNLLGITLDARGGSVNGSPTIIEDSMLPFVNITNDSNKNLVLQQIAPISASNTQAQFNITAADDNFSPTVQTSQNPSAITIVNNGSGSVLFSGAVADQPGSLSVTNAGGDILDVANNLIQANQISLDASHGSIGSNAASSFACAICPGTSNGSFALGSFDLEPDVAAVSATSPIIAPNVSAVARGDINLTLTPAESVSGQIIDATPTVNLTNILAGGNLNLTLNQATIQGVELKTVTLDFGIFGTVSFQVSEPVNGPASNTLYNVGAGQWLAAGGNVNLTANGASGAQVTLQDNGLVASGFSQLYSIIGAQGALGSLEGADGQTNSSFLNYLQNFNDPTLLAPINVSTGGHVNIEGSGAVAGNGAIAVLLGGSDLEIQNHDPNLNLTTQALSDNGVSASTINIFGANQALSGTLAGSSVSLGHYGQNANLVVSSQGSLTLDGPLSARQGSIMAEALGDLNSVNGPITAGTQAILLSQHGGIDAGAVTVLGGFFGAEAANTLEADHGTLLVGGNANLTSDHGDIVVGVLEGTGSDDLTAAGDINIRSLTTGGDATLAAGGSINFGAVSPGPINIGADLVATANGGINAPNAPIRTGGDATLTARSGDINLGPLAVGGNAALSALAGSIHWGDINPGPINISGDLTAIAAGDLDLDSRSITVGGSASLTAFGSINWGDTNPGPQQFSAGQDLTATAGGSINAANASLTTGNDANLTARTGDINLGPLATGGDATLNAVLGSINWGDVNPGPINISGDLSASAGRDISLNSNLVAVGGSASLSAFGSINWGDTNPGPQQFSAGQDLTATAGGSISAPAAILAVGHDAALTAAQNIALAALTAGNDDTLLAGGDITFASIAAGHDALLTAGGNVSDGTGITAAHDAIVTAGGSITLDSVLAGNNATLTAGQNVNLGTVTAAAGTAAITATAGDINLGGVSAGLDAILNAGHDINAAAGTVAAARDAALAAGDDINLGVVTAGRNASLAAGHDVNLGSVTAGNDLALTAGNNLNGANGTLAAGHDLTVTVGNDINLGTATAGHDATLTAGRNLNLAANGSVTAGDTASLTTLAGDINLLGTVTAPTDVLTAYGNIFAGAPATGLVIGHTIELAAETGSIGATGNDLNLWMDSVQGATPTLTAAARGDINLNLTATNRDGVASTETDEPSSSDPDPRLFADITNLFAGGDLNLNLNPGVSSGAPINAWYEIPFGDAALVGGTANVNLASPAWDFDAVTFDADGTLGSGFRSISYTVNPDGTWTSTVTAADGSTVTGLVNFASSIANGVINLSDINAAQGGTINLTGTGQLGSGSRFVASSGPTSVAITNNDANLLLQSNNITLGFGTGAVNINYPAHGRFFNGTGIIIVPDEFGHFFFGNGDDKNGHDGDNNDPDDRGDGPDVPVLSLTSAAGINLNGTIANPDGATAISAQGSVTGSGLTQSFLLDLNSVNGALGTAASPLNLGITDGGLLNASSASGIWLAAPAGDLPLGSVATPGDISISTPAGSILDGDPDRPATLNLFGRNITLSAGNSIGDDDNYLDGLATGTWSLAAGNGLYLATPGNAAIAQLNARDAELQVNLAGGTATIAQANILDSLDVDADHIAIASLTHSDPAANLYLSLQGYHDGMAQTVTANLTSVAPVILEYASQNGAVALAGDWLDVDDAIIGQAASFSNSWLQVAFANTDAHGHAQSADLDFVGNKLDADASHSLAATVTPLRAGQTFTLPSHLTSTEYWMVKELR